MPTPIPTNDLRRHNAPLFPALRAATAQVIESGWYILGPRVREFEEAFARYCGAAHAVGAANGTAALELALRAVGVGPGDQVLTVANAGGYSTTAILAAGAEPVFADIDPRTLLLDAARAAAALTPRTRAVVATHLYGRMVDMPRVIEAARTIPVIEDCAQAHGAVLNGRKAGTWGALGCFSFYPTKNLGALGDGGAIVTNDAALAARVRQLRQYGWRERYRADIPGGRNSRLDEMQAAILLVKLPRLDAWNQRRRTIANMYTEAFPGLPLETPPPAAEDCVAHLYVVRTPDRERFRERLAACGVATDVHYPVPDHFQECWRGKPWGRRALPITERCCEEVVTLPCFPELTDAEVERVIEAVRSACG